MGRGTLVRCVMAMATLVAAAGLSGCVVGEIQQSLVEMNTTLVLMQGDLTALRTSAGRIAEMDAEIRLMQEDLAALRKTTARIAQLDVEIETGIEQLDSVGSSLAEVDRELTSVAGSLRDLDVHLASLRRTLKKVNSSVPFVDIADDAPVEDPEGK